MVSARAHHGFESTVEVRLLDDQTFAQRAVREAGVATIPVSSFYAEDAVTSVVRLCFSKKDSTLDAGVERLARARKLFA